MILASAQTKPHRKDIDKNLKDHYRMIELAAKKGASLIVFPELSITGYEREFAAELAFTPNDKRLEGLVKLSDEKHIIIIAGAPIKMDSGMYIGEFIIHPNGKVEMYTKQFLHTGEDEYYVSSFDYNPLIVMEGERISLAICADIDHSEHAENACKVKSTIYMPSIFFSPKGIPSAYEQLSSYANKHSMCVLMSNFSGESWGSPSAGRSAFWHKSGKLVAQMNDEDAGLLIVEKQDDIWTGKCYQLEDVDAIQN